MSACIPVIRKRLWRNRECWAYPKTSPSVGRTYKKGEKETETRNKAAFILSASLQTVSYSNLIPFGISEIFEEKITEVRLPCNQAPLREPHPESSPGLDQKKRAWFSTCGRSFSCYKERCAAQGKGTKTHLMEEK